MIIEEGLLFCSGSGLSGATGVGDYQDVMQFRQCPVDQPVASVLPGSKITVAIDHVSNAWICGHNRPSNCMGFINRPFEQSSTFKAMLTNSMVQCGSVGLNHFIASNNEGQWATIGINNRGQLGVDSYDHEPLNRLKFSPFSIDFASPERGLFPTYSVKLVAAGEEFSFLATQEELLFSCGTNHYGQLGLGNTATCRKFNQVNSAIIGAIKAIACGTDHTVVLGHDNHLWGAGNNNSCAISADEHASEYLTFIAMESLIEIIAKISLGEHTTACLTETGKLFVRGSNERGEIGIGATKSARFFQLTNYQLSGLQLLNGLDSRQYLKVLFSKLKPDLILILLFIVIPLAIPIPVLQQLDPTMSQLPSPK